MAKHHKNRTSHRYLKSFNRFYTCLLSLGFDEKNQRWKISWHCPFCSKPLPRPNEQLNGFSKKFPPVKVGASPQQHQRGQGFFRDLPGYKKANLAITDGAEATIGCPQELLSCERGPTSSRAILLIQIKQKQKRPAVQTKRCLQIVAAIVKKTELWQSCSNYKN